VKYTSSSGSDASKLRRNNSTVINEGNQSNCIAVKANGDEIDLYVNGQLIDSIIDDPGYSQGTVGLFADAFNNATTVTFQNATLWTL
jgi:hypothetical protein